MKQYDYGVWGSVTTIEDLDDPSTATTTWFPEGDVEFLDMFLPEITVYNDGKLVGHFMVQGDFEPYDLLFLDERTSDLVECAVVRIDNIWDIMKNFKRRR